MNKRNDKIYSCIGVLSKSCILYPVGSENGEVRYSPDTHIYQSEDITTAVFGTPTATGTTTPPSTPRAQPFASPRLSVSSTKVGCHWLIFYMIVLVMQSFSVKSIVCAWAFQRFGDDRYTCMHAFSTEPPVIDYLNRWKYKQFQALICYKIYNTNISGVYPSVGGVR